jgi:hypothetical protein
MVRAGDTVVTFRIVIKQPVPGVLYSLQSKDGEPLDPKASPKGQPLTFVFPVRVAPGPRFSGDQIRREGAERRFVYVRIGQMAGDASSPWSRRMKIDIHDIGSELLSRALDGGGAIEIAVTGTGKDGTPACTTVSSTRTIR